jgi:uncharacterized protein YndB with AHSA1/START domain
MARIKKSYLIDAPILAVWHALTNADAIAEWGAGPVDMRPVRGHRFSLWGGDIYGTVVDVEPPTRLVEEWFGGPWGVPSVAVFTLAEENGSTRLELDHEGVPADEVESFSAGWDEFYLGAMKRCLEEA